MVKNAKGWFKPLVMSFNFTIDYEQSQIKKLAKIHFEIAGNN